MQEVRRISTKTLALQIDESLHKEIKQRLLDNGKTLKAYIIDLIKDDLYSEKNGDSVPEKLDIIIELLQKIAEKK